MLSIIHMVHVQSSLFQELDICGGKGGEGESIRAFFSCSTKQIMPDECQSNKQWKCA